ncbi:Uncharacterised protein [Vibrio cholerae]|nr:Uncharacterised protein [Vibrio cholerae]
MVCRNRWSVCRPATKSTVPETMPQVCKFLTV